MPRNWDEISDDEMLNFEGAHTGQLHRYERIIQKKSIDALNDVRDKLTGLMETICRANKNLGEKTDDLIRLYEKFSKSQQRQQNIIKANHNNRYCDYIIHLYNRGISNNHERGK